ncbi:MAG: hypothetical protein EHM77_08540, partial [Planctomycetaceae bacterium]
MISRRQFVASLPIAASCLGTAMSGGGATGAAEVPEPGRRKRIAFLGTSVYQHSHAQHFLD